MPTIDEVKRLLGGTSYALQNVAETCSNIGEVEDLPPAFLQVARRLPHVQQFYVTVKIHIIESNPDEETCQQMKQAMEICKEKAIRLDEIFYEVVPKSDRPRMERYKSAAKGDLVEGLMKAVLRSAIGLAESPTLKASAGTQVKELQEALEEISAITQSLPDEESAQKAFYNYGGGWMNVNTGSAPQNNNNSSGTMITGPVHGLQLPSPQPPQ